MFLWLKRLFVADEPKVMVFLNPLVHLLAAAERNKGAPLTQEEVLAVRDGAQCTAMPVSQSQKFYAAMDAQFPVPRINPERCWEDWQEIRART